MKVLLIQWQNGVAEFSRSSLIPDYNSCKAKGEKSKPKLFVMCMHILLWSGMISYSKIHCFSVAQWE